MKSLNDKQIVALCGPTDPMINPFVGRQFAHEGDRPVVSYGLDSYGYDIRLSPEPLMVSCRQAGDLRDVKAATLESYQELEQHETENGLVTIIPPGGAALGTSLELFNMPRDVWALVVGKSTYAREFLLCLCTPLEAGWKGQLVVELKNLTDDPISVYHNEGIGSLRFFQGEEPSTTYGDRPGGGKYQNQQGITLSRV